MMQGAWGGSHEPCGFHMGLNVNMNTERYQREDISRLTARITCCLSRAT